MIAFWALIKPFLTVKNILIAVVILTFVGLFIGYKYYKGKVDNLKVELVVEKQTSEAFKRALEKCAENNKAVVDQYLSADKVDKDTDAIKRKITELGKPKKKPVVKGEVKVEGGVRNEERMDVESVVNLNNLIVDRFTRGVLQVVPAPATDRL